GGAMLADFKAFILRGNVIDLAVAVAIGAAFGLVVSSFTTNLLAPLLAIPGDIVDLADLDLTVSGATFRYGAFIDDVISFLITAAVLFFAAVRPVNQLVARRKTEPDVVSPTRDCPYCLSSIPAAATRCAFCTATVDAAAS
ncbi:MAG: large conductance mechanosensitive channel protein MscL, partial [Actinomycetota bacterium]|nr:large conductance mechanosensitive channel protein MscL [Actinomycetota bacterium]